MGCGAVNRGAKPVPELGQALQEQEASSRRPPKNLPAASEEPSTQADFAVGKDIEQVASTRDSSIGS